METSAGASPWQRSVNSHPGKLQYVERRGSRENLSARVAQLKQGEPGNLFAYPPLIYYRPTLSGRIKFGTLMNDRYPSVHLTRAREYVAREHL